MDGVAVVLDAADRDRPRVAGAHADEIGEAVGAAAHRAIEDDGQIGVEGGQLGQVLDDAIAIPGVGPEQRLTASSPLRTVMLDASYSSLLMCLRTDLRRCAAGPTWPGARRDRETS
jgi:hypothetical protein